jgi:integrase
MPCDASPRPAVILSPEEVLHFLDCVEAGKHRVIVTTCYAAGLRVSEAVQVRPNATATRGRPRISSEVRALIVRMSEENFLWGAPRIHGEPMKLGFDVSRATVSRYMPRRGYPLSQGWRTFLRNQGSDLLPLPLLCTCLYMASLLVRAAPLFAAMRLTL